MSRPRRRAGTREFRVGDELVLVAPKFVASFDGEDAGKQALVLNASGHAIWELCDGTRSMDEVIGALEARHPVDRGALCRQVDETLAKLARFGFIQGLEAAPATGVNTTFVIGVEDKPYFWWQTAIFLESFSGKLPAGSETLVVVCNDGEPLSGDMRRILSRYDTAFAEGANHAGRHTLDIGNKGGYPALNRVEALSVAGGRDADDDVVCLLDSDIFLYRDLNADIMPAGCALPRNWHVEQDIFFSSVASNGGKGVDLGKLLEAVGCGADFKPGGVNVFVSGAVAKNEKFVADCFRFAQAVFLLGRIAGAELVWLAEMPCFALAMTANGIDYDLLDRKELVVSSGKEETIPPGTLYHYYCDPRDAGQGAFRESRWHKQPYRFENFLRTDFDHFANDATTDHERYFFDLAIRARDRLYA